MDEERICSLRYLQTIYYVLMDTRFLETLITVANNGSFAAAARRLRITPAAVAQRIHALEQEIGVALVSRSGRTVRPTEAGAAIVDRARRFVNEIRDLRSITTGGTLSGELRLGAISTAISGLLPNVLTLLMQKYPQVEIYIMPGTSEELYHKVTNGDLDGAVIVPPPFALSKTCEWRQFREEPLTLLTPASMHVSSPNAILSKEPFIRYDRNNWGGRLVDNYLRHVGIVPKERFELDGLEAIAVLVDRGLGVALVPDWAPPWPEGLSLTKRTIADRSFARRVGLVWSRTSIRVRFIQALIECMTAALSVRTSRSRTQRSSPGR